MDCWKEKITEATNLPTVAFAAAKKFFAVDVSGSTHGWIIEAEGRLVENLSVGTENTISHETYWTSRAGTHPECILEHTKALEQIRSSDMWLLLTDGAIDDRHVTRLTNRANSLGLMDVPIILIVVGYKSSNPRATNISIAIPFFVGASNAAILYQDAQFGDIFVVAAKGCFSALCPHCNSLDEDLSNWSHLPRFAQERVFSKQCESLGISVVRTQDRQGMRGASLGPTYSSTTDCTVKVDTLLEQSQVHAQDLRHLLEDEAINNLAIMLVAVKLEDLYGAGKIMMEMEKGDLTPEQMDLLRTQLRVAHSLNRSTYTQQMESNEEAQIATELNRLINKALALLTSLEKAGYTAEILGRKSNRAMRANKVQAEDAETHLLAMDLSDKVDAFRSACSICAGEREIMSIVLKRLDTAEDNTTDFALNFPLAAGCNARNIDLCSSQCICFQCAIVCRKSIYQEELAAIIPTVQYNGVNKRYIDHQLCLAVTAGLNTGASGTAQIFMVILDRVLETKAWCKANNTQSNDQAVDQEKIVRRQAFNWTLQSVLRGCEIRETFSEIGPWVSYPQALMWALNDYEQADLDSWIIQYPVSGFCQIIRWYGMMDEPLELSRNMSNFSAYVLISDIQEVMLTIKLDQVEIVTKAKLIHLVVATMMNALLCHQSQKQKSKEWFHPFISLIYSGFNAPGIPRDMRGFESILSPTNFWPKLEDALGDWPDVKRFLSIFSAKARTEMCRRIQLVVFWVIFTQQGHTTPKTFFHIIADREPLGSVALGKSADLRHDAPQASVLEVLTSIFRPQASSTEVLPEHKGCPPFISPFGASVLHCGFEGCNVKFYDPQPDGNIAAIPDPNTVRQKRAQHLREIFAEEGFASENGLPRPTEAPDAPTSSHYNLHRSIARVWSRMDRTRRICHTFTGNAHAHVTSNGLPSKEEVYDGDERALNAFVEEVMVEICAKNGRGDIYRALEDDIRGLIPSFRKALRVASGRAGLRDPLCYVHDWMENSLEKKIEWELSLEVDA
ncbi:MAG: hypothetical protein Q9179_002875 [Wetmoreana sp. 5 TL-2023]